jgi:hypothetical protein
VHELSKNLAVVLFVVSDRQFSFPPVSDSFPMGKFVAFEVLFGVHQVKEPSLNSSLPPVQTVACPVYLGAAKRFRNGYATRASYMCGKLHNHILKII